MKLLSIPLTLILFALLFGIVLKLSVWLDSSEVLLAGNILSVYSCNDLQTKTSRPAISVFFDRN
ncbi:MAG: hypothetical protein A2002_01200 [Pseudomonadales bacterium GWC1_66_9]|nr:MAG: hypothetical protein A2002_01200 [Pseudomonadales bacterium GWC1_66_9]